MGDVHNFQAQAVTIKEEIGSNEGGRMQCPTLRDLAALIPEKVLLTRPLLESEIAKHRRHGVCAEHRGAQPRALHGKASPTQSKNSLKHRRTVAAEALRPQGMEPDRKKTWRRACEARRAGALRL